ncbi:restriction endonuclease subunit S [Pseudoalteromonas sp. P1-25]|uniref:restriction endonuclease subunit S n=1 Tax=Pseudoalteromonas sp. P1-25 TaxID=1723758 RepID=UPI0006D66D40|nr:restriction endonuclease subunit S [Pseudoalteromonas sp. P1-25]KPZ54438.1 Type-1 restriction enzyme EcoKI specificity protein [Pseudoalteromonas sp. P1-25]
MAETKAPNTSAEQLITDHLDIWTTSIEQKSSSGRGSSKKFSLHGIKKLRELILELAVRGKLVPQDPNDEPASVLLERIAAEKAQLVKDKKIKKPKALPEISEDEKPFELPKGWLAERLVNLSYLITKGTTPTSLGFEFKESGVNFIKIENVSRDRINLPSISQFISKETNEALKRSSLEAGDLLFSIAGTIGKTCIVVQDDLPANTNQALAIIRGTKLVFSAKFLLIQLNSFVAGKTRERARGGAMPNVSLGDLNELIAIVPPFKEQQRIVTRVDELMSLCDALEAQTENSIAAHQTLVEVLLEALLKVPEQTATPEQATAQFQQNWQRLSEHFDTLFTTTASIDTLKQTILQLAVMGKLVPQNPNDEPAAKLLERIAAEKAQLIKDKKIKKQKPLPEITHEEKPFELPKGWEWCRFDDAALSSSAGWSPQCLPTPRNGEDWGVLKVSAVTWGIFNPEENKELPEHLEPRIEHEVQSGDFLISRANTADLVAKAVIVPDLAPKNLMMSDKIIRFKLHESVSGEYLNLMNNSQVSRDYYNRVAGGTSSSMKNVSREQIRSLVVALPPQKEQHRIVAKVDELMALCEQLKARITDAQTTKLHLTDAIVEQAL